MNLSVFLKDDYDHSWEEITDAGYHYLQHFHAVTATNEREKSMRTHDNQEICLLMNLESYILQFYGIFNEWSSCVPIYCMYYSDTEKCHALWLKVEYRVFGLSIQRHLFPNIHCQWRAYEYCAPPRLNEDITDAFVFCEHQLNLWVLRESRCASRSDSLVNWYD